MSYGSKRALVKLFLSLVVVTIPAACLLGAFAGASVATLVIILITGPVGSLMLYAAAIGASVGAVLATHIGLLVVLWRYWRIARCD
jgi:multisubunit Na+/H+ antiporter MnhG subunit